MGSQLTKVRHLSIVARSAYMLSGLKLGFTASELSKKRPQQECLCRDRLQHPQSQHVLRYSGMRRTVQGGW